MPQKLVECEHCHGTKLCKADHGKSCDVCRRAVGQGRRGAPTPVRCSFCTGHGRIWMEVAEAAEPEAAEPEAAKG
jgi:hypothetical protein